MSDSAKLYEELIREAKSDTLSPDFIDSLEIPTKPPSRGFRARLKDLGLGIFLSDQFIFCLAFTLAGLLASWYWSTAILEFFPNPPVGTELPEIANLGSVPSLLLLSLLYLPVYRQLRLRFGVWGASLAAGMTPIAYFLLVLSFLGIYTAAFFETDILWSTADWILLLGYWYQNGALKCSVVLAAIIAAVGTRQVDYLRARHPEFQDRKTSRISTALSAILYLMPVVLAFLALWGQPSNAERKRQNGGLKLLNLSVLGQIQEDNLEFVREFVKSHPDVGAWTVLGANGLDLASSPEMARLLLDSDSVHVDQLNGDFITALSGAIIKGDSELAEFYISRGADVNKGQLPPILFAATKKDLTLVRLLLEAGADTSRKLRTKDGNITVLESLEGKPESLRILEQAQGEYGS